MVVTEHAGLRDFLRRMNDGGISTIVSRLPFKKPSVGERWKEYQSRRPSGEELDWISRSGNAPFVICGAVSGGMICFDFETRDIFDKWRAAIDAAIPGLMASAYIERSPNGVHVPFQCSFPTPGGKALAYRADNTDKPLLIEYRGEAQGFVCAPADGYVALQGSLLNLPVLSEEDFQKCVEVARSFDELGTAKIEVSEPRRTPASPYSSDGGLKSWEDYNERGDVLELLRRHGAEITGQSGENVMIRRPGKQDLGASATFNGTHFFNFSTNWPPFEANKGYNRFQVYALLEHRGDFTAAASELRRQGHGGAFPDNSDVDLSFVCGPVKVEPESSPPTAAVAVMEVERNISPPGPTDPGPFPEELFNVPGFIGEVVDHNLATAKKPQPLIALASAIALQSALAGRKVRDPLGNRTNLYVMAVAPSGEGKAHGMQLNEAILEEVNLGDMIGGSKIASDAGLLAAVAHSRSVLFQIDEIGRMLSSIGDPKKAPHLYNIPTTLMELYSASGGIFRGKSYAGNGKPVVIHQPCVNLIGYTTADWFYSSFTPEMLRDGFVGRMLVFESKTLVPLDIDQEVVEPPESIIEQARWWSAFNAPGNLQAERPNPIVVPRDEGAKRVLRQFALDCDAHKEHRSLWSRVVEKACRLSLVYALSRNPRAPVIDEKAAFWGGALSHYLTERFIYEARLHIAESEYERRKNKVLLAIKNADGPISAHHLTSKTRWATTKERTEILTDLAESGEIVVHKAKTGGRPGESYSATG